MGFRKWQKEKLQSKNTEARTRSSWVLSPGANLFCSERLAGNWAPQQILQETKDGRKGPSSPGQQMEAGCGDYTFTQYLSSGDSV